MNDQDELHAGRTLGDYELIMPLAKGATASVWAARMRTSALEKIVAVKVMLTELADDIEAETMFLDEARIIARIRHPNVVSVLDFGDDHDALYIVMEWIEGEPLQVLMREAKAWDGIPMPVAVRIVKLAAAGLHSAHELCDEEGKPQNLVHRDVSPQNILIGYDGSVKVIDFGVAKTTSNLAKTTVGQLKGKAAYMAPEQSRGDRVDRRTDVFALGVVLYQLVTGRHPFRADNEFATMGRLRDPVPFDPPSKFIELPAVLEQVIMQALEKGRDKRFASMNDFARALEKAVPSKPDEVRVLGDLVRSLLSQRAVKKTQAIRDALKELGHDKRPVNLTTVFDDVPRAPPREGPTVSSPSEAAAPPRDHAKADLKIPGLAAERHRMKLIAAGVAIFVALVLALLAVFGGSGGREKPKRAF